MDYNQESFLKPPFYMTYPMQNLFQAEMEYEKDMERMKELYPREVKSMMRCIGDQCDELEYEGSPMYDEYPDRLRLEKLADKIYAVWKAEAANGRMQGEDTGAGEKAPGQAMNMPDAAFAAEEAPDARLYAMEAEAQNRWFPMPEEFRCSGRPQTAESGTGSVEALSPQPRPELEAGPGRQPRPELGPGFRPQVRPERNGAENWERVLLGVLLNDEIYRRRCRNRRCRRWW